MRIVVIGHGMVGSRLVVDLLRADPEVRITVLGGEPHGPYNRVQLSSVVAGGADPAALALEQAEGERVRVLRGVRAVRLDREARTVLDEHRGLHPYDRVVLATGSAARIPAIPGIRADGGTWDGPLLPGVGPLKDMADAERIVAAARPGGRAVVLGAGVLGLEVATGLRARGMDVTLVHHRDRLMERQLDPDASGITRGALERLGIHVAVGVSAKGVLGTAGRLSGLRLSDGAIAPAELLVLCTGTLPAVSLAREAGLACEHGVIVGEDLSTPGDPAVVAIGDCAQPPQGASGLVAQGWEQARALVAAWTSRPEGADRAGADRVGADRVGADRADSDRAGDTKAPGDRAVRAGDPRPPQRHARADLVRVKAVGLPMVVMGRVDRSGPGGHATRSVRLSDPHGGRFTEVVVHEGRLLAATVIGDEEAAASLSAAFARDAPVPRDPVHLLARPLSGGDTAPAPSVTEMAEADLVCQCNGVTKGTICTAIRAGCASAAAVSTATRAGTGCGTCRSRVQELLDASPAGAAAEPVSA